MLIVINQVRIQKCLHIHLLTVLLHCLRLDSQWGRSQSRCLKVTERKAERGSSRGPKGLIEHYNGRVSDEEAQQGTFSLRSPILKIVRSYVLMRSNIITWFEQEERLITTPRETAQSHFQDIKTCFFLSQPQLLIQVQRVAFRIF